MEVFERMWIDMRSEIDKDIVLEGVLAEFGKLAEIPRMSGHEKAVSDFLMDYLKGLGFQVVQDDVFNIIVDKPATKGMEQAPLTILQSHMDMVCVADEGRPFDPLKDSIRLIRDDEYLRADGTSLGADDGIGVAEIIYILKNCEKHGPLRAIFTVDEERGMTGAEHLDKKYLADGKFLINCDSENYDELTIGCAGNVTIEFSRSLSFEKPSCGNAYRIEWRGLCGGHSGERIGDGRANAIRLMAQTLTELQKLGRIELSAFKGGKAYNAIPDSAEAVIVTDIGKEAIEDCLARCRETIGSIYGDAETNGVLSGVETGMPEKVRSRNDCRSSLQLMTMIHSGVYAMSNSVPGLVETSANMGVARIEEGKLKLCLLPRSAVDGKLEEFCDMAVSLGELTGFEVTHTPIIPGWKERSNSRLADIMKQIFESRNHIPMKVGAIHAAVECGWHYSKNPDLDIVSIGVTTMDIHSPRERVLLKTIRPQVELIQDTLAEIGEM